MGTGHAVSFFNDADGTIRTARNHFQNTRKPFTLTLAGEKIYVVTSPFDVADVNRNVVQLTFDQYIKDMMIAFGATRESVAKMWQVQTDKPIQSIKGKRSSPQIPLAHFAEESIRRQLLPGSGGRLEEVQDRLLNSLHCNLTMDNMSRSMVSGENSGGEQRVSLLEWTRSSLLEGATAAFFGPKLLEIEPDLFRSFFEFDDLSWKLLYKIPAPWSNDMNAAKAPAQEAITKFFRLPRGERPRMLLAIHNIGRQDEISGNRSARHRSVRNDDVLGHKRKRLESLLLDDGIYFNLT
ncbi:MAG: hypothetical protein Q9157_006604 [Trypethelium eluteriae]